MAKRLYLGLVRPVLAYAGPWWDSCTKADCSAVQRVQLSVARAILRCSRHSASNVDVLSIIGWPTLAWRRRRFKLLLLWHLLHGGGPPSLQEELHHQTAAARSSYSLRNQLVIAFPRCNSSHRRHAFLPSVIAVWNSLPSTVSSSATPSSFLRALDNHFCADKHSFGLTSA